MEDKKSNKELKKYFLGHRKRMREKFIKSKSESSTDSELLEMLLYLTYTRKDVKLLAKDILAEFKTLRNFLCISLNKENFEELRRKRGDIIAFLSKLGYEIILRSLAEEIKEEVVLSRWSDVTNYLKLKFGNLEVEQFSIMYLNHQCRLIKIVEFGVGTIDESQVYVREVIKSALNLGAKHLILCHNHPAGIAKPSDADIEITKQIIIACKAVDLSVLDHVIVVSNSIFSFREAGLLGKN